eukprot:TRINITY_DN58746_c0_g1_i1.p1 TRINITY_DN58746_c0_g1~~TRINITY_DN58746_c0_g1_i1.p1  ORF type:complete len:1186 (+),score=308.39 TRINITY_DN58746_c0_g1_i1:68-3625(+)
MHVMSSGRRERRLSSTASLQPVQLRSKREAAASARTRDDPRRARREVEDVRVRDDPRRARVAEESRSRTADPRFRGASAYSTPMVRPTVKRPAAPKPTQKKKPSRLPIPRRQPLPESEEDESSEEEEDDDAASTASSAIAPKPTSKPKGKPAGGYGYGYGYGYGSSRAASNACAASASGSSSDERSGSQSGEDSSEEMEITIVRPSIPGGVLRAGRAAGRHGAPASSPMQSPPEQQRSVSFVEQVTIFLTDQGIQSVSALAKCGKGMLPPPRMGMGARPQPERGASPPPVRSPSPPPMVSTEGSPVASDGEAAAEVAFPSEASGIGAQLFAEVDAEEQPGKGAAAQAPAGAELPGRVQKEKKNKKEKKRRKEEAARAEVLTAEPMLAPEVPEVPLATASEEKNKKKKKKKRDKERDSEAPRHTSDHTPPAMQEDAAPATRDANFAISFWASASPQAAAAAAAKAPVKLLPGPLATKDKPQQTPDKPAKKSKKKRAASSASMSPSAEEKRQRKRRRRSRSGSGRRRRRRATLDGHAPPAGYGQQPPGSWQPGRGPAPPGEPAERWPLPHYMQQHPQHPSAPLHRYYPTHRAPPHSPHPYHSPRYEAPPGLPPPHNAAYGHRPPPGHGATTPYGLPPLPGKEKEETLGSAWGAAAPATAWTLDRSAVARQRRLEHTSTTAVPAAATAAAAVATAEVKVITTTTEVKVNAEKADESEEDAPVVAFDGYEAMEEGDFEADEEAEEPRVEEPNDNVSAVLFALAEGAQAHFDIDDPLLVEWVGPKTRWHSHKLIDLRPAEQDLEAWQAARERRELMRTQPPPQGEEEMAIPLWTNPVDFEGMVPLHRPDNEDIEPWDDRKVTSEALPERQAARSSHPPSSPAADDEMPPPPPNDPGFPAAPTEAAAEPLEQTEEKKRKKLRKTEWQELMRLDLPDKEALRDPTKYSGSEVKRRRALRLTAPPAAQASEAELASFASAALGSVEVGTGSSSSSSGPQARRAAAARQTAQAGAPRRTSNVQPAQSSAAPGTAPAAAAASSLEVGPLLQTLNQLLAVQQAPAAPRVAPVPPGTQLLGAVPAAAGVLGGLAILQQPPAAPPAPAFAAQSYEQKLLNLMLELENGAASEALIVQSTWAQLSLQEQLRFRTEMPQFLPFLPQAPAALAMALPPAAGAMSKARPMMPPTPLGWPSGL